MKNREKERRRTYIKNVWVTRIGLPIGASGTLLSLWDRIRNFSGNIELLVLTTLGDALLTFALAILVAYGFGALFWRYKVSPDLWDE